MNTEDRPSTAPTASIRVELPGYDIFPNLEPLKVDERIRAFSEWLEGCGVSPENLVTEYLNELVRIAVETHGLAWSSSLVNQLRDQSTKMFTLLYEANDVATDIVQAPSNVKP